VIRSKCEGQNNFIRNHFRKLDIFGCFIDLVTVHFLQQSIHAKSHGKLFVDGSDDPPPPFFLKLSWDITRPASSDFALAKREHSLGASSGK
jgi:hypothetical protein